MHYKILNISRRITMNRYKGYLTGINPNYTRKVLQEEDPRYFAYESTTGTFVNGKDQEVKTMKEAVAANDKIDAEYKAAFPPQKAIGAKPVRYSRVRNVTPADAKPKIKPVEFSFNTELDQLARNRKELEASRVAAAKAAADFRRAFYNPLADEDRGKGLANIMAVDDV